MALRNRSPGCSASSSDTLAAMTDAIERLREIVEELQEMLSAATAAGDSETEGRLIVALTALQPLASPASEPADDR